MKLFSVKEPLLQLLQTKRHASAQLDKMVRISENGGTLED